MPNDLVFPIAPPGAAAVTASARELVEIRASVQAVLDTTAGLRRRNRELTKQLRDMIGQIQAEQSRLLARVRPAPDGVDATLQHIAQRSGLTRRELEVAKLLAEGRRNTAIAAELGISPHTARHHTQHVLAKLGVHSRAEAGARLRG